MFRDAKVGDRIYHWYYGWGVITEVDYIEERQIAINEFEREDRFPILAKFCEDKDGDAVYLSFTIDGFGEIGDENPIVFWDKPQFEIPKKHCDLKDEYKKLKRKEFVYKEDYIKGFIEFLNKNKVTVEQLEQVIQEVENEVY